MTRDNLVKALLAIPENLPVIIIDADTGWLLNINTISNDGKVFYLSGHYNDEFNYPIEEDK
jgi:hypothetical protein